jgi:hypothetical protein
MSGREPDPATYMIDVKVTGIVNAARKIPITASPHSQEANEGGGHPPPPRRMSLSATWSSAGSGDRGQRQRGVRVHEPRGWPAGLLARTAFGARGLSASPARLEPTPYLRDAPGLLFRRSGR